MGHILAVVGTGTEVGKTHVTCALLVAARKRGFRAVGFKPIATGVPSGEVGDDARAHAEAAGTAPIAPLYAYARPVSPHLAARAARRPIAIATITVAARELARAHDLVIVEGVGGLFTPLVIDAALVTNADLVRALNPDAAVLVASDRLGVLHDLGATLRAATAEGLSALTVVLSSPRIDDESTGTNADEIRALGLGRVVAVFPRSAAASDESRIAAERVLDAITPS